jgi:N-carbamoyl-L-amino-acid hydrolase
MSEVDVGRLRCDLDALGRIGAHPGGGMRRPGFGPEVAEAAGVVAGWMREAGMTAGCDAWGNTVGLLPGAGDGPPICVGSHLDTVPDGGRYDGAMGVLAGLAVARAVGPGRLGRPLAVVGFADEEGNAFGVGCLASRIYLGEDVGPARARVRAALDARGAPGLPRVDLPRPAAYLELHLEQGPVLDRDGGLVAAVDAIAGIDRADVSFVGEANNAGTTPMAGRRDALWGAAQWVLAVRDLALASGGRAVATVGALTVHPGATNVIPGRVDLRLEVRAPEAGALREVGAACEAAAHRVAVAHGLAATVGGWHRTPPVALDAALVGDVRGALRDGGYGDRVMPSWAGHDAKIMAAAGVPAAMIFNATRGGRSHCPEELVPDAAVAAGAAVLLRAVERADARLG